MVQCGSLIGDNRAWEAKMFAISWLASFKALIYKVILSPKVNRP